MCTHEVELGDFEAVRPRSAALDGVRWDMDDWWGGVHKCSSALPFFWVWWRGEALICCRTLSHWIRKQYTKPATLLSEARSEIECFLALTFLLRALLGADRGHVKVVSADNSLEGCGFAASDWPRSDVEAIGGVMWSAPAGDNRSAISQAGFENDRVAKRNCGRRHQ